MSPVPRPELELIAELNHQINSPLAAARNALFLAQCCSPDSKLHRYLQLAHAEITAISVILKSARLRLEVPVEASLEPGQAIPGEPASLPMRRNALA